MQIKKYSSCALVRAVDITKATFIIETSSDSSFNEKYNKSAGSVCMDKALEVRLYDILFYPG